MNGPWVVSPGEPRGQNHFWAWAVLYLSSTHARPDVRKFLTSGCVQSPSFPYHVTKKRRALRTRMGQQVLPSKLDACANVTTCCSDEQIWNNFSVNEPMTMMTSEVQLPCGRHYILLTKTTSIERDWDWIWNNLKVVNEDSWKMYGWYARTTKHPNTRSDVLTTGPPGL